MDNKNNKQSETEAPLMSLTDSYWKLVELDGQQVEKGVAKKNAVHFMLHEQDQRVAGFNGCNRFFGQFELINQSNEQRQLKFSALGATKMACQGLAFKESKVMNVFYKQTSFQISGESLTFYDQDAKPLAIFRTQQL